MTGEAEEAEELDWGLAAGRVIPTEEQTPWAKARVSGWKSVFAALASVVGVGFGSFFWLQVILSMSLSLHAVAICPCNAARNEEALQRQW